MDCDLWRTPFVGLHAASSMATALAYFTLPLALVYFVKVRRCGTVPHRAFWLVGLLLTLGGLGSLLDVVSLWYPVYGFATVVRAGMALAAVCTVGLLIPRLRELLALKTPSYLAKIQQQLKTEIYRRRDAQTAFYGLVSCTSVATGSEYFSTLVVSLAMILDVSTVVVAERTTPDSSELHTLGMWHTDKLQDNITFEAVQDLCAQTMETRQASYCLNQTLPTDHPMAGLGATTYLGVPLLDGDENVIGILCVLHDEPLEDLEMAKSFLQAFAARSAAELKRNQAEQALLSAYDNLESRIQQRTLELQTAKESAEVANRAKSTFLAKISHELRTPLNVILGFTQVMAQDDSLSVDHSQSLEIVGTSGSHLLDLINNILEFTKLDTGHATVQLSDVDVPKLIYGLGNMMQLKAKQQGLQLTVECDLTMPRQLRIDVSKLRQIILNLLDNAIKYTQEGRVLLKAYPIPQGDTMQLGLKISDTGRGISPSEQQKMFKPFYQSGTLSTVHDASEQGVGLGLAICQGLIKLMGGHIRYHSQLGQGTTFSIQLPVTVAQLSPARLASPTKVLRQPRRPQQRHEILVVEDAPTNRLLLKHILGIAGFEVREAENGQQAIEQWESSRPALILMDIQMPIMNGYDATAYIRQRDPQLPIIALTASIFDTQLDEIFSVGCNACIHKPFDRQHLLSTINGYLTDAAPSPLPGKQLLSPSPSATGTGRNSKNALNCSRR